KGLKAHFTFLDQFDNLTADINFMGLLIKDKYSNGEFGESTLKAQFNTAMIPTQMALHISQVTFAEKQNHFKLNNIDVKFNNAFSDKGMPIGNFSFKMGVFEFIENDLQLSFDRFLMNASGAVQDSLVKYTWHTQLNNLIVPTPDSFRDTLSVNFSADMILQRLDEGALLALHTTVLQNESVNIMVILGKFMEVLPKLLAQSPEIELSNVLLETSFGNVTASARISLDGKKVTSLEESVLRSAVQGNVAVKISQKLLKQMLLIQTFDMMLAQNDTDTLTETEMTQLKQQAETSVQQQIDMIVIMGFLEKTAEGDYQAVANFQENKLILNGKLIPLPGSNHGQTQIAPQKDSIEVK
ncbi:MAG: DUF945 family protein, partial [Thiomargarita sp.]|nr:DUF945 family protein [Thiomargarita sp.]